MLKETYPQPSLLAYDALNMVWNWALRYKKRIETLGGFLVPVGSLAHSFERTKSERIISLLLSIVFFTTTVLSSFPAHAWNIWSWGEEPVSAQTQPQEDPYEDVQRVGEAYIKTLPEDSAYRSMVGSTFVLPYKSHTNVLSSSELTQEFDRVSDLESSKKELALQSTKIYLNQALFNMMILEHTFGLRSQVTAYSKIPLI